MESAHQDLSSAESSIASSPTPPTTPLDAIMTTTTRTGRHSLTGNITQPFTSTSTPTTTTTMAEAAAAAFAAVATAMDLKAKASTAAAAAVGLVPEMPSQQKIKKCAFQQPSLSKSLLCNRNNSSNSGRTRKFNAKTLRKSARQFNSRTTTTTTTTTTITSNINIRTSTTTAAVCKRLASGPIQRQQQLLEQKLQEQELQQQQQLYPQSKETFLLTLDLLAVVRRNASDKLKLIQMVHDNPILWDSRLPNFKGAEEEKTRAWDQIGKEFSAPGRRVARAFKSLRESYRRELAHVKLMGNGFKPKWSLFEAMDFLRDVIRERKGGAHATEPTTLGLNLSAFTQSIGSNSNSNNNNNNSNANPNNNNNNNNNNHHNHNNNNHNSSNLNKSKLSAATVAMHLSSFNDTALNLSKCTDDYYSYIKPETDISHVPMPAHHLHSGHVLHPGLHHVAQSSNGGVPLLNQPQAPPQQHHQQQQSPLSAAHDSRVSSTRNDNNSTQNTTYDDLDASSMRSGDDTSMRNAPLSHQGSDEVEELDAIDADFPYPLILDGSSRASGSAVGGVNGGGGAKRRRKDAMDNISDGGMDVGDEDDEYEGQMLQQHRALRQQNGGLGPMMDVMLPPLTVREVLNSKFCGFISAKLNSMGTAEADSLMTKILMLLVQTQTQTQPQTNNVAGPATVGTVVSNGENK